MLVDTLAQLIAATGNGQATRQSDHLWTHKGQPLNRVTGYRWIKTLCRDAEIAGAHACPKGLRHGFGVNGILAGVPLNLLSRWLGHASLATTAIYTNAIGREEMAIAERMWGEHIDYWPHS